MDLVVTERDVILANGRVRSVSGHEWASGRGSECEWPIQRARFVTQTLKT